MGIDGQLGCLNKLKMVDWLKMTNYGYDWLTVVTVKCAEKVNMKLIINR